MLSSLFEGDRRFFFFHKSDFLINLKFYIDECTILIFSNVVFDVVDYVTCLVDASNFFYSCCCF